MSRAESIKKWNESVGGKAATKKYRKATPALFQKGGSQYRAKMLRYKRHNEGASNSRQDYTISDDDLICAKAIPDIEIALKIGRSLKAISNRRYHITKIDLEVIDLNPPFSGQQNYRNVPVK